MVRAWSSERTTRSSVFFLTVSWMWRKTVLDMSMFSWVWEKCPMSRLAPSLTVPWSSSCSPRMQRMRVDFPDPFGPTIPQRCPRSTRTFRFLKRTLSEPSSFLYCLVSERAAMTMSPARWAFGSERRRSESSRGRSMVWVLARLRRDSRPLACLARCPALKWAMKASSFLKPDFCFS